MCRILSKFHIFTSFFLHYDVNVALFAFVCLSELLHCKDDKTGKESVKSEEVFVRGRDR